MEVLFKSLLNLEINYENYYELVMNLKSQELLLLYNKIIKDEKEEIIKKYKINKTTLLYWKLNKKKYNKLDHTIKEILLEKYKHKTIEISEILKYPDILKYVIFIDYDNSETITPKLLKIKDSYCYIFSSLDIPRNIKIPSKHNKIFIANTNKSNAADTLMTYKVSKYHHKIQKDVVFILVSTDTFIHEFQKILEPKRKTYIYDHKTRAYEDFIKYLETKL